MTCPENEKSVLYKSVYNESLNLIRNRKVKQKYISDYFYQLSQNSEEARNDNSDEIQNKINRAIDNLPEKCRQIFILNKIEGLTQKEIAGYLGISVKTVENQVANAIIKLRIELKPILHLLPLGLLFFT